MNNRKIFLVKDRKTNKVTEVSGTEELALKIGLSWSRVRTLSSKGFFKSWHKRIDFEIKEK